ncbi:MAG TPA: YggT family protein [Phycicoccus sp.]|jgi:YggT family protein|nr:YggT family protein [Phycicoccus sp.]HQH06620.1 YggT family protein [Phycicoccus sp.]HQK30599.1 YggT family protein [Phycicoccus sp.]HQV90362.1 YggT family protein [Phycicoccus sp.]HQY95348.1 YggT family protein [Phycicoccus sp.]
MYAVRSALHLIVWLYLMVVFGRLVLDWIRIFARDWRPRGVVLVIAEAVYTLTDPPLNALRKVIPPLRLGAVSLDLGFIVLVLGLYVLLAIL